MSRLFAYLFYRHPRLRFLVGAIPIALGLMLGLLGTKQIDFVNCSPTDCLSDSTELVYIADWDKDLIVLGPSNSATYYIIYPSRFSPPLDRATFKTNASITLTEVASRVDDTDLGFTLRDHNGDSSHTGSIVEQLSWEDARGLDHTSTTDLYQTDPSGFQEFQFSWSAGRPFYTIGVGIWAAYVILWLVEAKRKGSFPFRSSATAIPSRPTRKRTSSSSGRTRPEDT